MQLFISSAIFIFLIGSSSSQLPDATQCPENSKCFTYPNTCSMAGPEGCIISVELRKSDPSMVSVKVRGHDESANTDWWVAVGFNQNTAQMFPSAVLQCVKYGATVAPFASYSTSYTPPVRLDNNFNGIGSSNGSTITCEFKLPIKWNLESISIDFEQKLHVNMAKGLASTDGNIQYHTMREPGLSKVDALPTADGEKPEFLFAHNLMADLCSKSENRCLYFPSDCKSDPDLCDMTMVTQKSSDSEYLAQVHLSVKPAPHWTDYYVAFGVNQNKGMTPSGIVECVSSNGNVSVKVSQALSPGRPTPFPENSDEFKSVKLHGAQQGEGIMGCSFSIPKVWSISSTKYELEKKENYFLLARGEAEDGQIKYHGTDKTHTKELDSLMEMSTAPPSSDYSKLCAQNALKCYGVPNGCVKSRECDTLVVIPRSDQLGLSLTILSKAPLSSPDFYSAVGFTREPTMPKSIILACTESNGVCSTETAFAGDRVAPVKQEISGIRNSDALKQEGLCECNFDLEAVIKATELELNLADQMSSVLVANGRYGGGLSYHGANKISTAPEMLLQEPQQDDPAAGTGNDASKCGASVGCVAIEPACISSNNCESLVTYKPVGNKYQFEIIGKSSEPNHYVALGISPDSLMPDSFILSCIREGNSANVVLQYASARLPPVGVTSDSVSQVSSEVVDGVVKCVVDVDKKLEWSLDGKQSNMDLGEAVHLIVAAAKAEGNTISYHGPSKRATPQPISLDAVQSDAREVEKKVEKPSATGKQTASAMDTSACSQSFGCFALPTNCLADNSCQSLVRYRRAGSNFEIEVSGTSPDAAHYVAVGLSNSSSMPESFIASCIQEGDSASLTYGYANAKVPPTAVQTSSVQGSSEIVNGVLKCKLNVSPNLEWSLGGSSNGFNLNNPVNVLIARGASGGGSISYHGGNKAVSGSPISLASTGAVAGASNNLIKAHGSLMIIAWLLLTTTGVLAARYYKPMWPDSKPLGVAAWFAVHRPFMVLAVACSTTAFVLIFIEIGDWAYAAGAHPYTGTICAILGLCQPLMAFFRCHPGTPKRGIFNWAHWGVGWSAQILGLVTILLGMRLPKFYMPDEAYALVWVYVVYFICHDLLQEGIKFWASNKKTSETIPGITNGMEQMQQEQKISSFPPGHRGRSIMFFIHVIFSIVIAVILIVLIATNN